MTPQAVIHKGAPLHELRNGVRHTLCGAHQDKPFCQKYRWFWTKTIVRKAEETLIQVTFILCVFVAKREGIEIIA